MVVVKNVIELNEELERLRRENDELHSRIAGKDKFFSIIAHDLRSPFSSFLGMTQLIEEEMAEMTREEIHAALMSMRRSATKLYSLLQNLLDWSRLQQGIIPFFPELFVVQPRIVMSAGLEMELIARKGIEVVYDIIEGQTLYADVKMFDSIIRNLLSNAVKFTANDGSITIAATPVSGDLVEISVTDTGIGMSRELADDLFRMSKDIGRTGTDGEQSTGLGLIICRDFIEKHGGKLSVKSEKGKGSTFSFSLPAKMIDYAKLRTRNSEQNLNYDRN